MLKVLMAEDEVWIRKGIIKCIDWESLGLQLVGEASDGQKALELIRSLQPDLVIIDIHMPVCKGLEVMQKVKDYGWIPKFVIISGYNQFEYAQEAIALGALAYLLKPVKKAEINRTLTEAVRVIQMEKELHQYLENAARQLSASHTIVKERIMLDFLSSVSGKQRYREIITFSPYYAVIVWGFDGYLQLREHQDEFISKRNAAISRIEAILSRYEEGIVFEKDENCFVVILGLNTGDVPVHLSLARKIHEEISEICPVSVGVGHIHQDVRNIKISFNEALNAYREKLVAGGGKIFTPVKRPSQRMSGPDEQQIKALCLAVELSDLPEIRFRVLTLLNDLVRRGPLCYETVRKLAERILNAAADLANRYGIHDHSMNLSDIDFVEGINSLSGYLVDLLLELADKIAAAKKTKGTKAVEAAIDFIRLHYSEDLTLEKVAMHVGLHPNYLSEIFKKEVGVNFSEYVVNLKMDRAIEFMQQNPSLHVGKVAEMVGYSNTRYFSKLFYKRIGMRPTEYKQSLMSGQTEGLLR